MVFLPEWRPFGQTGLTRPSSLFDEMIRETFRDLVSPGGEGAALTRYTPRVNVTETDEAYEIECEVPGVDPEEVKVTLSGDTLTVAGEKRREEQREGDTWHVVERSYGSFQRSFTFPAAVDGDSVEATSEHGVLKVRVLKAKEQQPRRIEVRRQEGGKRQLSTTAQEVGGGKGGRAQQQEGETQGGGGGGGRKKS
ncbi:MAG: Hsp20/alpha crystallin family protein [Planctomycetes bacterium]|nr:Hsp20/alpha crystallin family protein [Planctomycetota bacterium]